MFETVLRREGVGEGGLHGDTLKWKLSSAPAPSPAPSPGNAVKSTVKIINFRFADCSDCKSFDHQAAKYPFISCSPSPPLSHSRVSLWLESKS